MISKVTWIHLTKKFLAEGAIVAVASVFVISALKITDHFTEPRTASSQHLPIVAVGSHLSIAGVDFRPHPFSLVLVSSPECPYCRASESFHANLIVAAKRGPVPLFVAIPNRTKAASYLREVGFPQEWVKEWKDLNLRVDSTPMIVAVDGTGIVRSIWIGVLPPYDESALLKSLDSGILPTASSDAASKNVKNYSSADLSNLRLKQKVNIVDIHERNFPSIRPDATDMPALELPYRAAFELDRRTLQLVDCSNLLPNQCDFAVQEFKRLSFNVATLDAGLYRKTCKATFVN